MPHNYSYYYYYYSSIALLGCLSLSYTFAKSLRYQAPDECKWYAVTGDQREVGGANMDGGGIIRPSANSHSSSIAEDEEVALVCKVKTMNSDMEKTNLSVIQPQYTVRLKLICAETVFVESSLPCGSFQTLIDLKDLSIDYCKISELPAGAFKGLRRLVNLTVSTRNNDWTADMILTVRPDAFSGDLHSLERLDLNSNNIRSLPVERAFCQLQNLRYLNLSRNELNRFDEFGFSNSNNNDVNNNEVEKCLSNNLKILDLSDNVLDSLPQRVFGRLGRLEELYLQNNVVAFLADRCFDNLNALSILNLANNKLVNLPPELFADSRNLKEIHLQNNTVNVLAPGLFSDLEQLLVLDLSLNELTEEWVNSATFVGLRRLLVLNLSFNNITKLDGYVFRDLERLQVLRLESNALQHIPENAFSGLKQLTTLLLSNNRLGRLDGYAFDGVAGSVNVIALDNNRIETITDGVFENASRLEDLHLNENRLRRIPTGALTNTPNLKTLDLGANRIDGLDNASFPTSLAGLVGLRLTENNLTFIDRGVFDRLVELQIINLSTNRIARIESGAFDANLKLVAVRIDGNYLTEIGVGLFSKLPNLVWLNISENFLQLFDYSIIPTGLQWLDVHGNKIAELGNRFEIENQLRLTVFDVRNNLLNEITGNSVPDNVQTFYLADNRITKIQSYAFFKKPNLTRVDLSGNRLKTLTPHSLRISSVPSDRPLPEFYLAGNPFQCDCTMQWLQTYNGIEQPERNRPILADLDRVRCELLFDDHRPMVITSVLLKQARLDQFVCRYELECAKRTMCDCCDYEACDCKMICPANCTCYLSVSSTANIVSCTKAGYRSIPERIPMNVTQLYLDGNDFRTIPIRSLLGRRNLKILFLNDSNVLTIQNRSFHGLKELEILRLNGNRITVLKGNEFDGLDKLRELYLNDNRLNVFESVDVFTNLYSLNVLHLHRNLLTKFAVWELPATLTGLTLSENVWSCECDFLRQFQNYLRYYAKNYLLDTAELKCYNELTGDRYRINGEENLRTFCISTTTDINNDDNNSRNNFVEGALNGDNNDTYLINEKTRTNDNSKFVDNYLLPTIIILFGSLLLLIVLIIIVVYYKEPVRVWFYSKFGVRLFYPNNEIEMNDREKLFDAFVSYSVKDETFVAEELAPILENGDPPYKLCLYYREFPIGGYMSDTIMQAVESSRRTIMILSENLIKSEWCRYEFKTAYHQILRDRRKRLIIVLLGDIQFKDLDPLLRVYIKNNFYLQWGDKLFWQKLRFALPDVPNNQRTSKNNNTNRHQHHHKRSNNQINSHHLHRPLPDIHVSNHRNHRIGACTTSSNTIAIGNTSPTNNRPTAMRVYI